MAIVTPIKRSKELRPLSREHHDGLLLCWKIRTGIKLGVAMQRIITYVKHFYAVYLENHFDEEEQFIFTLLDDTEVLKVEALNQHQHIRRLIGEISNNEEVSNQQLTAIADLLDAHIRFEERQLFNRIERTATPEKLILAGSQIATNEHNKSVVWQDEFWIIK